jgi:hypothetical protein
MSDAWETDTLAELVDRKLRVLIHLRELTVRQPALIAADDWKTLLRVFAAKQKLLEEVQRIDRQLEPFRSQEPEQRRWRSPDARAQCRRAAERCRELIEEIKASEASDKHQLVERREAVARHLEQSHAAAAARVAYRPVEVQSGLDLSSES